VYNAGKLDIVMCKMD